jgi:uncharacterized protein (DUF58 family)
MSSPPVVESASEPDTTHHGRFIAPTVLSSLANLELVARTVAEGTLMGLHRTPKFGFSQEFAEYRAYEPGDDLRHIDWNVYARSDRTYIKRFSGDTNNHVMVLVDQSSSMGVNTSSEKYVSKCDYARFMAAAFVYLAARQHDAIGLLLFSDAIGAYRPPSTRPTSVRMLYHLLDDMQCTGGSNWHLPLAHVQSRLHKRSLLVVISDFYTDPAGLREVLKGLAARGHDLLLVHVLDPAERKVALTDAVTLEDSESGAVMEVSPDEMAAGYETRLRLHVDELKQAVLDAGGHYLGVTTDQPLDRTLADYLRFRARRQQ